MTIEEKAKQFAEGKALNAFTQVIEEAYKAGYIDGFNDRQPDELIITQSECDDDENDGKYVDLALPSGTKWAEDFERDEFRYYLYLPYCEANKYHLPTTEQFQELLDYCNWDAHYDGEGSQKHIIYFNIVGANGNYIRLNPWGYQIANETVERSKDYFYFWLKNEDDEGPKTKCVKLRQHPNLISPKWGETFSGNQLPILQVK